MSKHTKGPWTFVKSGTTSNDRNGLLVLQHKYRDAKNIAFVIPSVDITDEEQQANARLIAEAPVMLAVLQTTYEVLLDLADLSDETDGPMWQGMLISVKETIDRADPDWILNRNKPCGCKETKP